MEMLAPETVPGLERDRSYEWWGVWMDFGGYWMQRPSGGDWEPVLDDVWYTGTAPDRSVQGVWKGGMVGVVGDSMLVHGDARMRLKNRYVSLDLYRITAQDGTELDQTRVRLPSARVGSTGRFSGAKWSGGFAGPEHEEVFGEVRVDKFHGAGRLDAVFGARKQ